MSSTFDNCVKWYWLTLGWGTLHCVVCRQMYYLTTVAYWGGGLGCSNPCRNSKDIGGVLDRTSKKNWHLNFLL